MDTKDYSKSIVDFVRSLKAKGTPEKENMRQIGRYLEMKARERGIPINGCFELTPFCNLDCKMCYVHLDSHQFSSKDLLSVDEWKYLMQQAFHAGMKSAILTGGECLTYPAFDELYLFLYNMGVGIDVLSNGLLIDEARIGFFLQYRPKCIKISLYGSCEDAYENVTGHRVFSTIYNHLKLLRDSGLPLFVSITPSRFMQNDMAQLIQIVEDLNVRYEINARLFPPRANTGRTTEDLSLDQYVELYRLRLQHHKKDPTPVDPKELPDINHDGTERHGLRCGAGRSSFTIKYDGSMCPCVSLEEFSVSALNGGFNNAWEMIKEYAKNYPVSCECEKCVYLPVCVQCEALHKNAPRGHCDSEICERTKRLAQEGFFTYLR